MKGKIIKNPQLDVFQIPLVSVINMDHELVILAQRIDWKSVDKEFSIYYPYMERQAVPVRKMVVSMILKQMYNLGDETFVATKVSSPRLYICFSIILTTIFLTGTACLSI